MMGYTNPSATPDEILPDGRVAINADELSDLRFTASQYLPYKEEATRLADALHNVAPDHPLLRGELWQTFINTKEKRAADGRGVAPDTATMMNVASATDGVRRDVIL
jgi:hypothetical protein